MDKTERTIRRLSVRRIVLGVLAGTTVIALALAAFTRANLTYSMNAPDTPSEDSPEAIEFLNLAGRLTAKRSELAVEISDEAWEMLVAETRPVVADLDALASLPEGRLVFAAERYPNEKSRLKDGMRVLRNLTAGGVRRALRQGDYLHAAHLIAQALRISAAASKTGNRDDVLEFVLFSQAFSGPLAWMVEKCEEDSTRRFLAESLVQVINRLPPLSDAVRREWAAVARALDDPRWIDKLRDDYDFFDMRPGRGELQHWTVWTFQRRTQVRALEMRYREILDGVDRPYCEVGPAIHDHNALALVTRLDPAPEWREQAGRRARAATRLLLVALEMQTRANAKENDIPLDPLTGKPFLRRDDGLWYSIGVNGQDDGGKTKDLYGEEGDLIYRDYRNGKPATWTP